MNTIDGDPHETTTDSKPRSVALAANISTLFTEFDFPSRIEKAADAGFKAVEVQYPYGNISAKLMARELNRLGLSLVLLNAPPGRQDLRERGLASLPGRESEFRRGIADAIAYAGETGCSRIHVLSGVPDKNTHFGKAETTALRNFTWAAGEAQRAGVEILIEPINHRDFPGYFIQSVEHAASLIERIGSPSVRLQFDIYHCQVAQGDITRRLETHFPLISHIQIADVPGRSEPGTGEIGWAHVFGTLCRLGYRKWVGCEYVPLGSTFEGLSWRKTFGL